MSDSYVPNETATIILAEKGFKETVPYLLSFYGKTFCERSLQLIKKLDNRKYLELMADTINHGFIYGCPLNKSCRKKLIQIDDRSWQCPEHGDIYGFVIDSEGYIEPNALKPKVINDNNLKYFEGVDGAINLLCIGKGVKVSITDSVETVAMKLMVRLNNLI